VPSDKNTIIIACAGSGKTTRLVTDAIARPDRRIALITYTINNMNGIINRFGERYGGVPKHVDVMTWFGFLLREGARPYQHAMYRDERIETFCFANGQSARYCPEKDIRHHYFCDGNLIYSDKIAKFTVRCEETSGGCVIRRLRQVYTDLFIDECQDLAGADWDLIKLLLKSDIRITLVGDPRQSVLSTNLAHRNKRYRKSGVIALLKEWEEAGLCEIEMMNGSYRCNRAVCDFANHLWPGMDEMTPLTDKQTEHDGVFLVAENTVDEYFLHYHPQVLQHNKKAKPSGYPALNFGVAKGMECDHVLIVPTGPIKKFLKTGDPGPLKGKEKLHVAITRARHSVAFVYDGVSPIVKDRWESVAVT
jgi:ATP-dependent DNA helicase UvrD/PcrA